MAVEGSTAEDIFEAHIECLLDPVLRRGQLLGLVNPGAHKAPRVGG